MGLSKTFMSVYKPEIFKISPNFLRVDFPYVYLSKNKTDPINDPINLLEMIKEKPSATYDEYAKLLDVSSATIKRQLGELKKKNVIKRVGANKNGHWEVISEGIGYGIE